MRLHTIATALAGGSVFLVGLAAAAASLHVRLVGLASLAALPPIVTLWRWRALHPAVPATIPEVLR